MEKISEREIWLNTWGTNDETIVAVQGEAQARGIRVHLRQPVTIIDPRGAIVYQEQPIDLTGKSVELWVKKTDGTEASSTGEIINSTEGIARLPITSQMCALSGKQPHCEVRVIEETKLLKAVLTQFIVLEAIDDSGVVSSDDYSVLLETIGDAKEATKAANTAAKDATEAAKAANNAASDVDTAKTLATEAAAAANSAAAAANEAKTGATNAASGANAAKTAAETAATAANEAAEAAGQVSGKLDAHTANTSDPHHTLAYITQDLQAGDLLKYDGEKLVKAVTGVDYNGPISTTTIDIMAPWTGYNEASNKIKLMRVGNRVYLDGMIKGGAAWKQIATLPEAYRTATDQRIMAAPCAGGMCRVDVYTTGALLCVGPIGTGAVDQWVALYGLSYTIY